MQEKTVIRLFGLYDKNGRRQAGSVYSIYGISPTLDCCGGGYHMPLIVVKRK